MRLVAWRVGLFALLGLALLAVSVVLTTGGWFSATERAVMRFDSSVFGLQAGAPVVFRGVRVGQVTAIGFAPGAPGRSADQATAGPAARTDALAVPVTAEFDRELLHQLQAAAGVAVPGATSKDSVGPNDAVKALVARGLVARLALQSLLTGQLYVDLAFDDARVSVQAATNASPSGLPLIPTAATRLQTLQAQLEGLDLAQIGRDVAAVAASARQLLDGPEPARALARTADAAVALETLALRLERDIAPLARAAQGSLTESQRAFQELGTGARQFGQAAQQVADAASQVQALARDGTPVLVEVQRAAAELGRAAASLRAVAGEDSTLRGEAERALQDVSRAARALREVGETLERHPDALLRGRAGPP